MARQSLNGVLQHIRKVAAVQTYRGLADRELLERFVGARDEAAFTVLIERHGPMVLGVCRRLLPSFHDAEDACQATFLVLARKAGSVRKKTSISSWLHGVAFRAAANLKRDQARRMNRDGGVEVPPPRDPADAVSWREVQNILDEELAQLPERYRAPMILCYLESKTRDEAAQQLGLSSGCLHGRLERARHMMRERLTQRGLTLAAVMSAGALGEGTTQAALAATFVVSSTRAAIQFAAGQALSESAVAAPVLALTQEVLKTMFLTKLKLGTAAMLCASLFVTLIGGSFTSFGTAQDVTPLTRGFKFKPDDSMFFAGGTSGLGVQGESDTEFIRRISKDLRGTDPTPTEIHFFVTSKDAGRRQKLIDLFIQERQAKANLDPSKEKAKQPKEDLEQKIKKARDNLDALLKEAGQPRSPLKNLKKSTKPLDAQDVYHTNQRRLKIPLDFTPRELAKLKQIHLVASTDSGKTWEKVATGSPQEEYFLFVAPTDGLYWLIIQEVHQDGTLLPSQLNDQTQPALKIQVQSAR